MPLEAYVETAKQLTSEEDAVSLIREVIEHPQVFVFGELLDEPIVQSLKQSTESNSAKWYNLLELFAYGKLSDYNEQLMPTLTDSMIKKLRLLTIITLTNNKSKKIPYSVLSEELKVDNLRDLEDLIIEAIYANLIKAKLDQKAICLEIESTLARDVKLERIDDISNVLTNWITNCENILTNIEKQTKIANSIKAENLNKKTELESYIASIKKTIKTNNMDMDPDVWEINSMQQNNDFEKNKRAIYNKQSKYSLKSRNQRN